MTVLLEYFDIHNPAICGRKQVLLGLTLVQVASSVVLQSKNTSEILPGLYHYVVNHVAIIRTKNQSIIM